MVTVKEIAKICGVSVSTVSNVLNGRANVSEQTRQRVLEAIEKTGYQPNYFASSMRKQNNRMIVIIAEDLCQFSTTSIVGAAMACCEEYDYRTMLMNLRLYDKWQDTWYNDERRLENTLFPVLNEVQAIKADGIIYVAGHCRVIKTFPQNFSLPTVIAYATADRNRFPSVVIDDERGGCDMVRYLLSMGHREIGIVAGTADNIHTESRLTGCRRAFFEAGIPFNPARVVYGDWGRQSGYDCAAKLANMGIKAIWCMNDQMAGGVYDYAHEHGLAIGKDLSVAGYDNMQISQFMYPKLTTNELPLTEIGGRAAETLLRMLAGEADIPAEPVRIPCTLKLRDSVCGVV